MNIILVSFDSLRSDCIANLKSEEAPFFCLLRDQGAFFRNTIVHAPFTVPSHTSMLSGLYPVRTGVRDMHHQLLPGIPTIFTILKKEGYSVLSFASTPMLTNRGFKDVDRHLKFSHKAFEKAITEINDKRFFAFFHYWDTHTPYETRIPVAKPVDVFLNLLMPVDRFHDVKGLQRFLWFLARHRIERIRAMLKKGNPDILAAVKKGYLDAVRRADKFIGGIIEILNKRKIADKTLLVITGDHGDSFNEHNEINRQPEGRYEHGHFLYDNILKVPLIFHFPNKIISRTFNGQVQQTDMVPTLLEALKINHVGSLDGASLWKAMVGKGPLPARAFTFSEVVRESRNLEIRCVRSTNYKLIYDYKVGTYELYDLQRDPDEKNNLWGDVGENEEIKKLLNELRAFSEIENAGKGTYSDSDQRKIENVLKGLGYI